MNEKIKETIANNILNILPENIDENGDNQYDVVINNNSIHIKDNNKIEDKYGNLTNMIFIDDTIFIDDNEIQIFFETPNTHIEALIDQMKAITKAIKESFK